MTLYHRLDIVFILNQHTDEHKTLIEYFNENQVITFISRIKVLAWC